MSSVVFNVKELSRILRDIYLVTGIRLSIFEPPIRVSLYDSTLNFHNYVAYPGEMPPCFCRSIRKSGIVDELCLACDEEAIKIVNETKKTLIYKCHFGFWEALIPVVMNDEVVSICFLGQIKNSIGNPDFSRICEKLSHLDTEFYDMMNREELKAEYNAMKIMSDETISALCRLLENFIPGIVEAGLISTTKHNIKSDLLYYVNKNIHRHIKLSDVTAEYNISQAHLCRIVKQEFGMSFTEYVNDVKINKAKEMLLKTNYSVTEISQRLGFDDSNYFSRLFKKMTGMNAMTYRKNVQNSGENSK